MTYLSSLPPDAGLLQIFQAYPDTARPLLELHEEVMRRSSSSLTAAERELIAAYVSGLNDCDYCHGVHSATAVAFGVPPELLTAALADLDSAPVSARMKAMLGYLAKLTRTPAQVTRPDAEAVFAAGWDERALHDAVLVCGLFNFMNRMVDGLGIQAHPDYVQMSGERLHDIGYTGLATLITS
jgi:uncharacterized peroxidase-related enzyme